MKGDLSRWAWIVWAGIVGSPGLGACGSEDAKGDASATDTSVTDTGTSVTDTSVTDTGTSVTDTGVTDTGTSATDTGTSVTDTSATDTSVTDTGVTDTSAPSCEHGTDCAWCTFASAPASSADCYCTICQDTLTTTSQCEANQAAWESHCAGELWASTANCPVPRCAPRDPLACLDGTCQSGCNQTDCPALACDAKDQATPPGQCCPHCVGEVACESGDDCVVCPYTAPVASADDCYCTFCGEPRSRAICDANGAAWQTFCSPWPKPDPCPVASCVFRSPPVCALGSCGDDPETCQVVGDCTKCTGNVATHAGECRCPACPAPHSQAYCDAVELSNTTVCAGFDFASCPLPPCVALPEATCLPEGRCGLAPEDR